MTVNINEIVNKVLFAYAELAGLDPGDGRRYNLAQYQDKETIRLLNESRNLDSTGLTTFMLLRGLMDHFIENTRFSAKEIFNERVGFEKAVAQIRKVFDMVEAEPVVALIEEFQTELRAMGERYQVKDETAFSELLNDKYDLALLRRDALRSIDTLDAFQFTQGKAADGPLKLNGAVYEFWNINSLLAGLQAQNIAGVSLCLIRDPDQAFNSYFVFAIRNGDTITILTDREEGAHPAYNRMSRRPDRNLERRAEQHWFPYHLLSVDTTDHGRRLYTKQREDLVSYNLEAIKLTVLGALHPEEIVWAGLLLDLIDKRFGKANLQLPALSYTGEMAVRPEALVASNSALVKAGNYKPYQAALLASNDITAEKTAAQWGRKPTGRNEWMIKRYGGRVPEDVLNPVGGKVSKLLAETTARSLKFHRAELSDDDGLEALSPLTFGTIEKLETDRVWVARVNQCKVVQVLAVVEFNRDKQRTIEWFSKHLKANKTFLLNAAARGSLLLPDVTYGSLLYTGPDGERGLDTPFPSQDEEIRREIECLRRFADPNHLSSNSSALILGKRMWTGNGGPYTGYQCAVTGARASVFTEIRPTCPEAIAILAGVTVDELPYGLRQYYSAEPYDGNCILDRCDPSDWILKNPWRDLKLTVGITLSRTAINSLRKDLRLPPLLAVPRKTPGQKYFTAEEIVGLLKSGAQLNRSDNHMWLSTPKKKGVSIPASKNLHGATVAAMVKKGIIKGKASEKNHWQTIYFLVDTKAGAAKKRAKRTTI